MSFPPGKSRDTFLSKGVKPIRHTFILPSHAALICVTLRKPARTLHYARGGKLSLPTLGWESHYQPLFPGGLHAIHKQYFGAVKSICFMRAVCMTFIVAVASASRVN